jgi:hypothetical protein
MGLANYERRFLAILERATLLVVRPFTSARDLASYANRGYALTGVLLAFACSIIYYLGYLREPVDEAPSLVVNLYRFTLGQISWWPWRDTAASLVVFPFLLYALGTTNGRVRRAIGKWTVDTIIAALDLAIALGEWCLENPWKSVGIAMTLVLLFVISLSHAINAVTERQIEVRDLEYWFDAADQLVNRNTMTGSEATQYALVHARWHPGFTALLEERSKHHSVECLRESIETLYSSVPTSQVWVDTLKLRLASLEASATGCDKVHETMHDAYLDRAFALSHLLLGRVYTRLSETEADSANAIHNSHLALQQFEIVEKELKTHLSKSSYVRYLGESINGQGTVYANALTITLQQATKLDTKQIDELRSICTTSYDCVLHSYYAYDESSKSFPSCSFESKRMLNNTIDLLSRVGANYALILQTGVVPASVPWSSQVELATELRERLRQQVVCIDTEPFVPATLITIAQGFSVLADLQNRLGSPWQDEVRAAGLYLRLSSTFYPTGVASWDLSYFCPLYKTQVGHGEIISAVALRADYLGKPEAIVRQLDKQCR